MNNDDSKRLDRIESTLDDMYQYMKGSFDEIDEKFEKIDEKFEKIDKRLDGIDERLDGIDEKIATMQNDIDYLVGETKTLSEDHEAAAYRQNQISDEISDHNIRITKLEPAKA